MSVSVHVHLCLGVRVSIDKLYKSRAQQGCTHWVGSVNFCSQCGAPKWKSKDVFVDGYDPDRNRLTINGRKYHVVNGEEYAIICWAHAEPKGDPLNVGWADCFIPQPDVQGGHPLSQCMTDLEPLGLWDLNNYGWWAVGQCHG